MTLRVNRLSKSGGIADKAPTSGSPSSYVGPAAMTSSMNSPNRKRRSSALLCALALLLALHPFSGSALGNGEALAALIKAVACECEACGSEAEAAPAEQRSCCDAEPSAEEESDDSCACGHPANFPLPAPTLLCEAPVGGIDGSAGAFLEQQVTVSAATLDPLSQSNDVTHGLGARPRHGSPVRGSPAAGEPRTGAPLGLADGLPARLAVLCTALV